MTPHRCPAYAGVRSGSDWSLGRNEEGSVRAIAGITLAFDSSRRAPRRSQTPRQPNSPACRDDSPRTSHSGGGQLGPREPADHPPEEPASSTRARPCTLCAGTSSSAPAQIPADEDDHRRHALCVQLLVNAVQVWNARYMTASIDHLHATKPDVVADETALARVAPVTHAHVNSLGRYDLHREPPPAGHLRPLRRIDEDGRQDARPHRSASVATNANRWISRG